MEPLNYQFADPQAAILNGIKTSAALTGMQQQAQDRQAQQQQALLAQQAAQQQQMELQRLAMNPNAGHRDYAAVMTRYPALAEHLGKAFKVMDEGTQQNTLQFGTRVYAAQMAGNDDLAAQLMEERAKADPAQAQHYTTMAKLIRESPATARTISAMGLAGAMGPDKFATAFSTLGTEARAEQKQPAALAKDTADAVKAQAEAGIAPAKAEADLAKTREEVRASRVRLGLEAQRLALDGDKFNLDFDTKLEELRQKRVGGISLSAGMEKAQADSVGTALVAKTASDQAAGLAQALTAESTVVGGKPLRWLAENAKRITGAEDGYTVLRQNYVRLRNQGLLSDLPPGPASDKDISLMKSGFPSEDASPQYIADWLTSYSKVQKAIALKEEAKADWISAVGAMKTAPQDIEVMGVRVPKGTSFLDFVRQGVKPEAAADKPAAKTGYLQKYGK